MDNINRRPHYQNKLVSLVKVFNFCSAPPMDTELFCVGFFNSTRAVPLSTEEYSAWCCFVVVVAVIVQNSKQNKLKEILNSPVVHICTMFKIIISNANSSLWLASRGLVIKAQVSRKVENTKMSHQDLPEIVRI